MKKYLTLFFLFVTLTSNAQRTMFGWQNYYVAPSIPFQAPTLVQNGLIQNLDASDPAFYAGSGSIWLDLAGNNNGTITGASYIISNSVGYFDINTKTANCHISAPLTKTNSTTFNVWAKVGALIQHQCMLFNAGPVGSGPDLFFYNAKIF
jgi:hypothetical protein